MNSNLLPLNKPLSLSFNAGITSKAIKDKVINGALNRDPIFFACISSIAYSRATVAASLSDMSPAIGRGNTELLPSSPMIQIPPRLSISAFTALQMDRSSTPTAIMLWQSCATVDAKAPDFIPMFFIKAIAGG